MSTKAMLNLLKRAMALHEASDSPTLQDLEKIVFLPSIMLCRESGSGVPPNCKGTIVSVEDRATPRVGMAHRLEKTCPLA